MFNGIEEKRSGRIYNKSNIVASVRVKRSLYEFTSVSNTKDGYDILIFKNGKLFTESKNVANTENGLNKKMRAMVNFYNTENRAKMLGDLGKVEVEKEKAHLLRIARRDGVVKVKKRVTKKIK